MKWKDIKLATLQKMFSAEGSNIPSDDSTRDYLAGMPYVANEGLLLICTSKKPLVRSVDLDFSKGEIVGEFRRFVLPEIAPDFFEFYGEVYHTFGGSHQRINTYYTEANKVLLISKDMQGIFTVYYKAYPEEITSDTSDDYEPSVPPDVLAILPLYMASQLYKEDDNGIATSLRNEFEVAYDRLSDNNPSFKLECNESGW